MDKITDVLYTMDKLEEDGFSEYRALRIALQKRNSFMKEHGFVIDLEMLEEHGIIFDCHTHGLKNSRHHSELQIMIPDLNNIELIYQAGTNVIYDFIDRIDNGRKFKDGDLVGGFLPNDYKLKLKKYISDGEEFLRILIPDDNGHFIDDENCHKLLKFQTIK